MSFNAGNLPGTDCPATCSAKCEGWNYFGLQDGQDCFCSNSSTAYASQGPSYQCNIPCTGNVSVVCGGPCANSVYWNGPGPAPPPPPVGPPSPPLPSPGDEASVTPFILCLWACLLGVGVDVRCASLLMSLLLFAQITPLSQPCPCSLGAPISIVI
jgi:hypothetical protein